MKILKQTLLISLFSIEIGLCREVSEDSVELQVLSLIAQQGANNSLSKALPIRDLTNLRRTCHAFYNLLPEVSLERKLEFVLKKTLYKEKMKAKQKYEKCCPHHSFKYLFFLTIFSDSLYFRYIQPKVETLVQKVLTKKFEMKEPDQKYKKYHLGIIYSLRITYNILCATLLYKILHNQQQMLFSPNLGDSTKNQLINFVEPSFFLHFSAFLLIPLSIVNYYSRAYLTNSSEKK